MGHSLAHRVKWETVNQIASSALQLRLNDLQLPKLWTVLATRPDLQFAKHLAIDDYCAPGQIKASFGF